MGRLSTNTRIQSDSASSRAMLEEMAAKLDGKGQIKTWATERGGGRFEVRLGKLDFIEKQSSLLRKDS